MYCGNRTAILLKFRICPFFKYQITIEGYAHIMSFYDLSASQRAILSEKLELAGVARISFFKSQIDNEWTEIRRTDITVWNLSPEIKSRSGNTDRCQDQMGRPSFMAGYYTILCHILFSTTALLVLFYLTLDSLIVKANAVVVNPYLLCYYKKYILNQTRFCIMRHFPK